MSVAIVKDQGMAVRPCSKVGTGLTLSNDIDDVTFIVVACTAWVRAIFKVILDSVIVACIQSTVGTCRAVNSMLSTTSDG